MARRGRGQDFDGDGILDAQDNCTFIPNAGVMDCDTDQDGYGNVCDGDFNNDFYIDAGDFSVIFFPDFAPVSAGGNGGLDTGSGTNMDCSLPQALSWPSTSGGHTLTANDFALFMVQFHIGGPPGPSGLACAGTVPCP